MYSALPERRLQFRQWQMVHHSGVAASPSTVNLILPHRQAPVFVTPGVLLMFGYSMEEW